jgi:hypothetical protein
MKLFYLISGALILIFSVVSSFTEYKLFDVEKNGVIVKMKIIEKPKDCIGTTAKYHMKVEYDGKIFSKEIASSICDSYKTGDYIAMRYLKNVDEILYPNESITWDYIMILLFFLFSIYLIVKGVRYKVSN